ncbi:Fatty acid synthase-like protein, partial [Dinothrombium tinctorium]
KLELGSSISLLMAEVKTHNSDTEIVISGISGRFPESDDIYELWENLIRGTELSSVDDRRWPVDVIDVTRRSGKVKHVEKFDAEFFSVSEHDAHYMDPQIRLLHETTWEAIFDAGLSKTF